MKSHPKNEKNADNDRESWINIIKSHFRGLQGREKLLEKLAGDFEIVAMNKIWIKPKDLDLIHRISTQSSTTPIYDRLRGFGEAALTYQPDDVLSSD